MSLQSGIQVGSTSQELITLTAEDTTYLTIQEAVKYWHKETLERIESRQLLGKYFTTQNQGWSFILGSSRAKSPSCWDHPLLDRWNLYSTTSQENAKCLATHRWDMGATIQAALPLIEGIATSAVLKHIYSFHLPPRNGTDPSQVLGHACQLYADVSDTYRGVSDGLRWFCVGKGIIRLLRFVWAELLCRIYWQQWLETCNDWKDCNDYNGGSDDNMMTLSSLNLWVESYPFCFQQWTVIIVTVKERVPVLAFLHMPS